MEEAGYNITEKEFKQISKWAENIYNIAVIVDYFVSNQPEIEELYNLAPVIKSLRDNADLLNAFLLIMYNKFRLPTSTPPYNEWALQKIIKLTIPCKLLFLLYRTLKTIIVPNEKAPEGANSINGTRNVLLLEPLKAFLHVVKNEEYQHIEDNLIDLAA